MQACGNMKNMGIRVNAEMRDAMEDKFLQDDDLKDLFAQLDEEQGQAEETPDPEMEASQRRYQEIINKHKNS